MISAVAEKKNNILYGNLVGKENLRNAKYVYLYGFLVKVNLDIQKKNVFHLKCISVAS